MAKYDIIVFETPSVHCTGEDEAYVADARLDTCSREVFRHDSLKNKVRLSRVRNHFICKYQKVLLPHS